MSIYPGSTVTISASGTTARGVVPTAPGYEVRVCVAGTAGQVVFVKFGGATVEAATTDFPVLALVPQKFVVPPGGTHMAAILGTGTATVYVSGVQTAP